MHVIGHHPVLIGVCVTAIVLCVLFIGVPKFLNWLAKDMGEHGDIP